MTQTPSQDRCPVEFNHGTYKVMSKGGHPMDGDKTKKVDERMMCDLIGAYERVEDDMEAICRYASRLEKVAERAVDMYTAVSDDPKAVTGINRDLNDARRDFATGLIGFMVDFEEIEDIIDERMEYDIGGFGDDRDDDEGDQDDDVVPGSPIDIPVPPEPPESGDETDLGYISDRIDFLTQCLKIVTETHLGYAQILAELAKRVSALEDAVMDGDEDDGGED